MFGLESVGPGRDVRVEGAGVPEFETPLGAPAADLAAQAWRGQVDEPRDDKLAELRTWVDGLPGKLRDSFLGEAVAGFEEVSNGIRDGLVQGFADAIRDVEDLGERLVPVRDAIRGLIGPVEDRVAFAESEVMSQAEEIARLIDAIGYVQGYQRRNWEHSGRGLLQLSYSPMGAARGGAIDGIGIELTSPGVWTVHFQAFGDQTNYTAGFGVKDEVTAELTIAVYGAMSTPDVWARGYTREVAKPGGAGKVSMEISFPVIVPQDGMVSITPKVYSARRRRFLGGERFSNLSAVKRDVETGPQGEETVPNA